MATKPTLTRADFDSRAWKRLKATLESARSDARAMLEADADEKTTWRLRGKIAQLNELLRLEASPAQEPRTGDTLSADEPLPVNSDGTDPE